ncbi:hypothetical protein EDD22DRAFT_773703, partial [Suillus occidentalis]
ECHNPTGCNKDWHMIWWNGMGHFLFNGRNAQPYSDAVKHFKKMSFSCVSKGCKEIMFKILDQGVAFQHAEHLISKACQFLVEKLVFEPSSSL